MSSRTRRSEPDLFSGLEAPPARPAVPLVPSGRFAEVAVEGPVRGTFTYLLPEKMTGLPAGARVVVPFGRRSAYGYFLGELDAAALQSQHVDPSKIKSIQRVLAGQDHANTTVLTPQLIALARWMAHHYAAPLGATLSAMAPAGVKAGAAGARVRIVAALKPIDELRREAGLRSVKKPNQAALLRTLADRSAPVPAAELLELARVPDSTLKTLAKAGLLKITEERRDDDLSDCDNGGAEPDGGAHVLNDEQQVALTHIEAALHAGASAGFLLHGVTGSGKTEVYLRALATALILGKQGIVLVPEIALTPQTARRFQQRLGGERVAVLHSHVTGGDRADAWRAIRAGKIDVVVGARSALFAPLPRLGLIVVDEEHETAFKQESTPRYHARDVAAELARIAGATLILGSATPSLESLHAAQNGRLTALHLTHRVAGRPLPPVEIVDLNLENMETKKYTYLSRRLLSALDNVLRRREQAILFMNRRGFATVLTCLHCGNTEKCEQCDITLTCHRNPTPNPSSRNPTPGPSPLTGRGERPGATPVPLPVHGEGLGVGSRREGSGSGAGSHGSEMLVCHYCGYTKPAPKACSVCGAPGVKYWGLGTERVEAEVRKAFPSARVSRMDSDTMVRRTAYVAALADFRRGKTDILVGTQMIAKGLDFPNVTLVGVVMADTALHMPDFRSRERTFQLLAQVGGRAGRGEKGGGVIVQTHLPRDPAVRAAIDHDYETFALGELKERRQFNYPPFTRLARILIRGKDAAATAAAAATAGAAIRAQAELLERRRPTQAGAGAPAPSISVLGPSEPPISKLEGYHRQHIVIKAARSEDLAELLAGPAGDALAKLKSAEATIDVDPLAMM